MAITDAGKATRRACIIGLGSLVGSACSRLHHIEFVPLVRLIATPQRYFGRTVATVGYLHIGAHPLLLISQDDDINARFNGVRADFPNDFYPNNEPIFENKNVRAEGVLQRMEPRTGMPFMRVDRLLIWPVKGPSAPPGTSWRRSGAN